MYCMKTQALVTPLGFCIQQSSGFRGAKHDFAIVQETAYELKEVLGSNYLLADKGYQGYLEGINKEIPYKKPRNGSLMED